MRFWSAVAGVESRARRRYALGRPVPQPTWTCCQLLAPHEPFQLTHLEHTRTADPVGNLLVLVLVALRLASNVGSQNLDEVQATLPALQAALVCPRNEVRVGIDILGALLGLLRSGGLGSGLGIGRLDFVFGVVAVLRELEPRVEQVTAEEGGALCAAGVGERGVRKGRREGLDLDNSFSRRTFLSYLRGLRARCCGWAEEEHGSSERRRCCTSPRHWPGRRSGGSRLRRLRPPGLSVLVGHCAFLKTHNVKVEFEHGRWLLLIVSTCRCKMPTFGGPPPATWVDQNFHSHILRYLSEDFSTLVATQDYNFWRPRGPIAVFQHRQQQQPCLTNVSCILDRTRYRN